MEPVHTPATVLGMGTGRAHQGAVQTPAQSEAVILSFSDPEGWALIIVDDHFPPEEVWEAWDSALQALTARGYTQPVHFEDPDWQDGDLAFFLLEA